MKLALTWISKLGWELELKFGRCMKITKVEPRLINDISLVWCILETTWQVITVRIRLRFEFSSRSGQASLYVSSIQCI
jgi:hypothetical protein